MKEKNETTKLDRSNVDPLKPSGDSLNPNLLNIMKIAGETQRDE